jgi:hypothetical protein
MHVTDGGSDKGEGGVEMVEEVGCPARVGNSYEANGNTRSTSEGEAGNIQAATGTGERGGLMDADVVIETQAGELGLPDTGDVQGGGDKHSDLGKQGILMDFRPRTAFNYSKHVTIASLSEVS